MIYISTDTYIQIDHQEAKVKKIKKVKIKKHSFNAKMCLYHDLATQ